MSDINPDYHIQREQPGRVIEALCGARASEDMVLITVPPSLAGCWKCVTLHLQRPLPPEPPTPEHDRLTAAKKTDDATQLVGEFFEWLSSEKNMTLAAWRGDILVPCHEPRNKLLSEFFGVSENALESERRALLDYIQAVSKARAWAETKGVSYLRRT